MPLRSVTTQSQEYDYIGVAQFFGANLAVTKTRIRKEYLTRIRKVTRTAEPFGMLAFSDTFRGCAMVHFRTYPTGQDDKKDHEPE